MPEPAVVEFGRAIEALRADVDEAPYAAADQAIAILSREAARLPDKETRRVVRLFARAALRIARVENLATDSNAIDSLFAPSLQFWQKERIAVLLLRLFCTYGDLVKVQEVLTRAPALFDAVFEENLYRMARLDRGKQTYAKIEGLTRLVAALESEMAELVGSLTTLDGLGAFRAAYLKKINSGLARKVLHPFIPDQLIEQRFTAVIAAIESFRTQDGPTIIEKYHEVTSALDEYIQLAAAMRTQYADQYCVGVARRLHTLTEAFFQATRFSKPAHLLVAASEKKYAFGQPAAAFDVFVDVTNSGPGFAFGVDLAVLSCTDNVSAEKNRLHLGGIEPSRVTVGIPLHVIAPAQLTLLELSCTWRNFDGSAAASSSLIEFPAQRNDIDWSKASSEDPYSLAAVSSFNQLVGRADILSQLIALTTGPDVESAFIRGQRRVGKTSIAKALASDLRERVPSDYVIVFLEAGDYVAEDAPTTIQFLGRKLCRAIKRADPRFAALPIPEFAGALSPMIDFLEDAQSIAPRIRMLFILDEFDDLPLDLYRRGLVGDAFFRTLRSISNKQAFGFILVGSEKMDYVLSCQGDALNKFTPISVDYFDKRSNWADFQDLVRRPAREYLDYSDAAVSAVYDHSAGNPYFAKLICRGLFSMMVERKDCFVTAREVNEAVETTLVQIEGPSFQHFWLDGIAETGTRAEELSILRRRVLLALAECLREGDAAPHDAVINRAAAYQISPAQAESELREFERRRVLVCRDGRYTTTVALFGQWLARKGYQHILVTFVDYDAHVAYRKQQEQDRVKDEEILTLLGTWDLYLGRRITIEQVRGWLGQFKDEASRRLMFTLLRAIRFYSGDRIRQKLHEAHGTVGRSVVWQRKKLQPKRRDLIVSALGGLAHSGAEYARRYADENMIYPDNVVPLAELGPTIVKRAEAQAVVLIHDFIGTGRSLADELSHESEALKTVAALGTTRIFLLAVVGFVAGQSLVEAALSQLNLPITIHICDPLDAKHQLFSYASAAFPDPVLRLRAKDVVYEHGLALLPDAPLGYGGTEAAIVFENKIPNNCPPILWRATKSWTPLFPRT